MIIMMMMVKLRNYFTFAFFKSALSYQISICSSQLVNVNIIQPHAVYEPYFLSRYNYSTVCTWLINKDGKILRLFKRHNVQAWSVFPKKFSQKLLICFVGFQVTPTLKCHMETLPVLLVEEDLNYYGHKQIPE